MQYYVPAISSALLCGIFIFFLGKIVNNRKLLVDKGIPLTGGLAIGLSFLFVSVTVFLLLKGTISLEITGFLIASMVMLALGVLDDCKELSVKIKFITQIAAAVILILFGVRTKIAYLGYFVNAIITLIWVIGITNSFNHLDVMDGVAGTVALIISGALLIIAYFSGDVVSLVFTLVLIGSLAGFLIFNLPPAKIYMGNSGSHFIGFCIASIAMLISYAPLERKVALLSPILALGFPIFDTAFLILVRLNKKQLPFLKSNDHLVLRFLKLGLTKRKALFFMLLLALFYSVSGVLLSQVSNSTGIGIIIFVSSISIVLFYRMSRIKIDG